MRIYKNRLTADVVASTKSLVDSTFNPDKNASNLAKHGLALADFAGFDAEPLTLVDDRFDYGEVRYRALGLIDGKPHVLVYTIRGEALHLISFRRAHAKEGRQYERRIAAP